MKNQTRSVRFPRTACNKTIPARKLAVYRKCATTVLFGFWSAKSEDSAVLTFRHFKKNKGVLYRRNPKNSFVEFIIGEAKYASYHIKTVLDDVINIYAQCKAFREPRSATRSSRIV